MFTSDEWIQLVVAAKGSTESGNLLWKKAKPEASFQVKLNKDTVALLRSVDGDGQPPFELAIFRRTIETDGTDRWNRFDSTDSPEIIDADSWGVDQLAMLFTAIARKANEVDSIFKSIMDTLQPED